jgi:bifunctional non-homologous end joining protein LigD
LEKVFWPEDGYTKHDLLTFYIEISAFLLPYLRDRPCNFQRFPDGIHGKSFYQKNLPEFAPDWIQTFPIPAAERVIDYVIVNSLETLVYVVNLACLEIHPWHSCIQALNYPTWGVVDLDPQAGVDFCTVLDTACVVKEVLDELQLVGYPKTSGATGLQIYLPLQPRYSYEQVRDLIKFICNKVHQRLPQTTTMERLVRKRAAAVYLDYLQNSWGKTINAPYTVRPVAGAQVSAPLTWDEVFSGKVHPNQFTIKNMMARVKEKGDLFAPVLEEKQEVSSVLRQL